MLRVLVFFAAVLGLAFGFAWLADRPGTVAIDWMGYQIELSAMVAMIGLVALIVAIMIVAWVLKMIVRSPQMVGGYFSSRKRDKGYEALSSGLVAAGSGDAKAAQRYAKQARKMLPAAPLTQVLAASSADLMDDGDAKRLAYRKMLDDPKCQLLGLRGLYLDAVADEDEEAARHYADQAAALAPALKWAGEAQFEDQVQRGDWPAARAVLDRNLEARIVSKTERNRLRAVLLTAEAIDREAGEPDAAKAMALEAHKLAPDLVPAAAVAGRLLIRTSKMTQASKVLETAWKNSPHPELAEVYLYVRPGDAVADRLKRARRLRQLCSHTTEGDLALARALMEAGRLEEARETLSDHVGDDATQRVCLLMAEIEEKDTGDTVAARSWMARALRAKRDPAWVADGYVSSTWEPVSPLSGRVDAFVWKVPVERYAAHEPIAIPAESLGADGQVMLPARLPDVVDVPTSTDGGDTVETVEAEPAIVSDADMKAAVSDGSSAKANTDEKSAGDGTKENVAEVEKVELDGEASDDDADEAGPDQESAPEPATSIESTARPMAPANDDAQPGTSEAPKAGADDAAQTAAEVTPNEHPQAGVDPASPEAEMEPKSAPTSPPASGMKKASGSEKADKQASESYSGLPDGHAPDDPGDNASDEYDGNPRRRFRLF
ncbi:MAG: heme biosynthesis HemY N-terminal domain-containing protein [Pseudomonadota bacterium]